MKKGFAIWLILFAAIGIVLFCTNQNKSAPSQQQVSVGQNNTSENGKHDTAKTPQEDKSSNSSESTTANPKQAKDVPQDAVLNVGNIDNSLVGTTVTLKCIARNVKMPKNTVFFDAEDPSSGKRLKGVLFNKTNNDNSGRKALLEQSMNNNMVIFINGEISEYKGQLEIKAWKVFTK